MEDRWARRKHLPPPSDERTRKQFSVKDFRCILRIRNESRFDQHGDSRNQWCAFHRHLRYHRNPYTSYLQPPNAVWRLQAMRLHNISMQRFRVSPVPWRALEAQFVSARILLRYSSGIYVWRVAIRTELQNQTGVLFRDMREITTVLTPLNYNHPDVSLILDMILKISPIPVWGEGICIGCFPLKNFRCHKT